MSLLIAVWLRLDPCARCVLRPDSCHLGPGRGNERGSSTSLKALTSGEADFRANDRDGNGVNDFWRKDVAGLYAATGADGKPMKLVEWGIALADDRSVTGLSAFGERQPKAGYGYRAIRHEDEDPQHPDPQPFAFAAIPVSFPRHSKNAYIVDEENVVYRSEDPAHLNAEVFPKDPGKAGWSKLD